MWIPVFGVLAGVMNRIMGAPAATLADLGHLVARIGGVGALSPVGIPELHDADVLRAPQVQHAVQRSCRKRHFRRLTAVGL
jgi:hypothetical protein